jgi:hypothetical protein
VASAKGSRWLPTRVQTRAIFASTRFIAGAIPSRERCRNPMRSGSPRQP